MKLIGVNTDIFYFKVGLDFRELVRRGVSIIMRKLTLVFGAKMPDRDTIVLEGRTFKAVVDDVAKQPEVPQGVDQVNAPVSPEAVPADQGVASEPQIPVTPEPQGDLGTQTAPVEQTQPEPQA